MRTKRTFLLGIFIIISLWFLSWILLVRYIPDQVTRGQFGDMFGAVNSLFSGMALCGVVYSILLQQESNRLSNYQFRFNHILDIVNKQTEIFNDRILEFRFQDLNRNSMTFSEGIDYFKNNKDKDEISSAFIFINKETLFSILPFIYHSNKFTYELIDEEAISNLDKERLKKLYQRNQNRSVVEYFSMNSQILEAEKSDYESLPSDLKEIHKAIFDMRISMIKSILENSYR